MAKYIGGDWWEMPMADQDRVYYANSITAQVSWEYPADLLSNSVEQVTDDKSAIIRSEKVETQSKSDEVSSITKEEPITESGPIDKVINEVIAGANQPTVELESEENSVASVDVSVEEVKIDTDEVKIDIIESKIDIEAVKLDVKEVIIAVKSSIDPIFVDNSVESKIEEKKPELAEPLITLQPTLQANATDEKLTNTTTSQPTAQWIIRKDTASGRIFYFDKLSHKTTFFRPADFQDESGRLDLASKNPFKWRRNIDAESGRIYYYNVETRTTRWKIPSCVLSVGGRFGIAVPPSDDENDTDDDEANEEKETYESNEMVESVTSNPLLSGLEATSPLPIEPVNKTSDDSSDIKQKKAIGNICNVPWSKLNSKLPDYVPKLDLTVDVSLMSSAVDDADVDDDDDKGRTTDSLKAREAIRRFVPPGIRYSGIVLDKGKRLQRRKPTRASSVASINKNEVKPKHLRSKSIVRETLDADTPKSRLTSIDLWATILSNLPNADIPIVQRLETSLDAFIDMVSSGRLRAPDGSDPILVELNYEDFAGKYFNLHRRSRGIFSSQKQLTTIDRVVTWKAETISTSLFPLESTELIDKAVRCFEMINNCTSKSDGGATNAGSSKKRSTSMSNLVWDVPNLAVQQVCDLISLVMFYDGNYDAESNVHCIQAQQLHDEFYCQLCKQTNGNPNDRDSTRCWLLMLVGLTCFLPSVLLRPYLANYMAYSLTRVTSNAQKAAIIRLCLENLLRASWIDESYRQLYPLPAAAASTAEDACTPATIIRQSIPSRMEIASIISLKSSKIRIWTKFGVSCLSDHTCAVSFDSNDDAMDSDEACFKKAQVCWQYLYVDNVTSWTTAESLVEMISEKLGVTNIFLAKQLFGVYVSNIDGSSKARVVKQLSPETRILDLLSKFDAEKNGSVSNTPAVVLTAGKTKKVAAVAKKGNESDSEEEKVIRRPRDNGSAAKDEFDDDDLIANDDEQDEEYADGLVHLIFRPKIWVPCDFSDPVLTNLMFLFAQEHIISGKIPCCERDAVILASLQFHTFVDEILEESMKKIALEKIDQKDDEIDDGDAILAGLSDGDYGSNEQLVRKKLRENMHSYFYKNFLVAKKAKSNDDDDAGDDGKTNALLQLMENQIIQLEYEVFLGKNSRMKEKMTAFDAKKLFLEYCYSWKVFGASYFLVQACNTIDFPNFMIMAVNFRAIFLIDIESKIFLAEIPWKSVVTWGFSEEGYVLVIGVSARSEHANPISVLTDQGQMIQDVMTGFVNALFPTKPQSLATASSTESNSTPAVAPPTI